MSTLNMALPAMVLRVAHVNQGPDLLQADFDSDRTVLDHPVERHSGSYGVGLMVVSLRL